MTIIVCDTGSGSVKLGLSSADNALPTLCVPNVIGEPTVRRGGCEYDQISNENETDAMKILRKFTLNTPSVGPSVITTTTSPTATTVIGDQVYDFDVIKKFPMKKGQVVDWDSMSQVWQFSLDKLMSDSNQLLRSPLHSASHLNKKRQRPSNFRGSSIVLSESVRGFKRDKLFETMFEIFDFDRINVSSQAALILSARGTNTGLVVDCGDGLTQITPVSDGFVQKQAVRTLEIAGRRVSERLHDLMRRSDSSNYKLSNRQCEKIKVDFCFLSRDIEEERFIADTTNVLSRKVALPDGTEVRLNRERFLAPEIFFEPKFAGDASSDSLGIASAIRDSISSSAIDIRSGLYKSIILAGGSTLIPGFSSRLKWELRDVETSIDEIGSRQFLCFQGGCVVAQLNEVKGQEWWISREDYLEKGGNI